MNNEFQKYESLFELAAILGQQNEFEEILRVVSLKASTLFDAEMASIMMVNPKTQHTIKTIIKEGKEIDRKPYQLAETNAIGWVMVNKQPFLSTDVRTDARFHKDIFEKTSAVHSVMCVALQCEGMVIGYLLVMNKCDGGAFDEAALHLLEKMAAIAAPFLSNVQKIQEYFAAPLPEAALLNKYEPLGLLGKSKPFIELLKAIEAAARCDVRVLLEGKTGTGKELVARAIHRLSERSAQPFVALDCGAIPQNLIESELFGHVKGAFTGATRDRTGLIMEAHQGTLFMDEIANLPLEMQAKLMRVLQEDEVRPVGSNRSHKVDVRIISASSVPLRDLVAQQKFREDLYYRLLVYPIQIPSLEERREDIPLLAEHFLKNFAKQQRKPAQSFDETMLAFLEQRSWPGNIRELENFVERLVAFAPEDALILDASTLPPGIKDEIERFHAAKTSGDSPRSLNARLQKYEEELLRQALVEHNWHQSRAAKALEIPEQTLRYKMNKLGIVKPQ
ncbi:sigma-54-dependent Fis family transcriptional regulator [candidate division KSB1 bacterium]|nr:sigma-54-dependent Fis family transcriptional regulator [candidate division KSB1 bacterium]